MPIVENNNVQSDSFETEELAVAEYYSRIKEQIRRKGYTDEIVHSRPDLPMLCQEYSKVPKWDSYALQPKLDGIRCIMKNGDLFTRRNKMIGSCPHISLYSNHIPEGVKLDGELIIPRTPLKIIESTVMRDRPQTTNSPTFSVVEYHVFDIINVDMPFRDRHILLQSIIRKLEEMYLKWSDSQHYMAKHIYKTKIFPFKPVPTVIHDATPSQEIIDQHFQECRKQGYEGSILRNANAPYEIDCRSSNILKKKEFQDHEFKIVDVVERKNKTGVFVCETHDGSDTFECSYRDSETKRRQILTFKYNYIGKYLQVEHEGIDPDSGKPRCPVGIAYLSKPKHE